MSSFKYVDTEGQGLAVGDVFDIGQTVNGQNLFYVASLEPLDVRYEYDRTRRYEYSQLELLAPDWKYNSEATFTILNFLGAGI